MSEWHYKNRSIPYRIRGNYITVQGTLSIIMVAFLDGTVTHSQISKFGKLLTFFFTQAKNVVAYEDLELQPMANRDKKLKKKSEGAEAWTSYETYD